MSLVEAHALWQRARDRAFTRAVARGFAGVGPGTTLCLPVRVTGARGIRLGAGVYVGAGGWLQALDPADGAPVLTVGDGCSLAGGVVLSAVQGVHLGREVLVARGVYVADHNHAHRDPTRAVLHQGVTDVRPVRVEDGAWLGQNVVITPGVTIGRGAVVGAGAVVRDDVPAWSLAVGAPARVVRSWAPAARPDDLAPP